MTWPWSRPAGPAGHRPVAVPVDRRSLLPENAAFWCTRAPAVPSLPGCQVVHSGVVQAWRRLLQCCVQEEFDSESPLLSTQRRDRVPRCQIQAALARAEVSELNPGDSQELSRTITNANSGYVHGTSEHILDMYGGNPPQYYLSSMLGSRRQETFENTSSLQ